MTTRNRGKAASKGRQVGDTYELKGHCLVKYPDGTVVTASRNLTLTQEGKYQVIYNADEHRDTSFTVNPKVTGDKG
jgi:hypothetical protein